ncbi:MAG: hypothetical protein B9S32_10005 [Verrucomicrobia bacterium Tous-C9LFEB]|nr:MAG: hypothetical protein B9S32_10005 [Verrucomicrobia bacterium Tous-C9LFEB]
MRLHIPISLRSQIYLSRALSTLALTTILTLLTFLVIVWSFQETWIYGAEKSSFLELKPKAAALGLLEWIARDGQQIGWQSENGTGDWSLLILHGRNHHALFHSDLFLRLREAGLKQKIYLLEYPGFGFRVGSPSEHNLVVAATHALQSIDGDVVVLGQSLGGGVACELVASNPRHVRGLVLLTPFDNLISAGKQRYRWFPAWFLIRDQYNSMQHLPSFCGPVSFILADRDTVTPRILGEKLYGAYSGPKRLWVAPNSFHKQAVWKLPISDWQAAIGFAANPITRMSRDSIRE